MATMTSYASVHDTDPRGVITYYGVIKDIIELSFSEGCRKIICLSVIGLITTRTKQANLTSHLLTL